MALVQGRGCGQMGRGMVGEWWGRGEESPLLEEW